MIMKKTIACFLLLLASIASMPGEGLSQTHVILPSNIARIHALSLAGAATTLSDDLGGMTYNPAAYELYREQKRFRFTLFLSPLAPGIVYSKSDEFFAEPKPDKERNQATALSFIKGFNITFSSLAIGFLFLEPKLIASETYAGASTLHMNSVYKNHFNTMIVRLRVAKQVSVGATLNMLYFEGENGEREMRLASSYGVFMQPSRSLAVGVSLHSLPDEIANYRSFLEEIADEAINIGISYTTPWRTSFYIDVRNIGVGEKGPREKYITAVEHGFFGQVALRGGLQYHPEDKSFVYSAGIGLLNLNAFFPAKSAFQHSNYAINYSIVRKVLGSEVFFYHAFNLVFRI